jgi:glyoxylase-like metal-dependent hydrolase (beta-lactamase superfamily II)
MIIKPISFGTFKTEGSSMFGPMPETRWKKMYSADENNLCTWELRSLLIDDGTHLVLIDTGFGNTSPDSISKYAVTSEWDTKKTLFNAGYTCEQVTHVLHTHLHLDHCGGSFEKYNNSFEPLFPNAKYIVGKSQLETATDPSEFEQDSFLPEITTAFIIKSNLHMISEECFLFPWLELFLFNGHTTGMIIPVIHSKKNPIVFAGDLIPSGVHLELQAVMNFDVNPMLSLAERESFLEEVFDNEAIIFFQHDYYNECCTLKKENSRIAPAVYNKFENYL